MVLSLVRQGLPAARIADVYVTLRNGMEVTFEVFEEDAEALRSLVGTTQFYVLDSETFWGQLKTLERCESTHQGLARLHHKPTLRGVLAVFEEATPIQ
jgi:hypothetical protein